jgi:transcriptional regulator of acetoin/glycerol metabolism
MKVKPQIKKLSQEDILKIWKTFTRKKNVSLIGLPAIIVDSWKRSKKSGVNHLLQKAPVILEGAELKQHKTNLQQLIDISLPIMTELYDFVGDAGFLIVLTDDKGCILEIVGPEETRNEGQNGNFVQGAAWSEIAVGANSIGTCLLLDQPIQFIGREHYSLMFHKWTCSAVPIHNSESKIIGVLDISGPIDKVHAHTLGMVVTAVNAIETQIKLQNALSTLESENNYKHALMELMSEGILALNSVNQITHMNKIMARYLNTNQNIIGKNFYEFMGENNKQLHEIISSNRFVTDEEVIINTKNGNCTYLVTSRPISSEKNKGLVLLFTEMLRAHRLVQKMNVSERHCVTFKDIIGKEPNFLETVDLAHRAASSISNVLLLGESGTGKDLFAQAIHNESIRKKRPFVAINCGAIPRELVASELFGYTEGAFTGAKRGGKLGKFELAHGGTIFLDEIGEMSLELQIVLLRVLETKTITRLGGNEIIPVDVRIIAATNKDLLTDVNMGKFRQDLYYRLNVFTIKVIPLRDRKEDIPLLVEHFLQTIREKLGKYSTNKIDKKVWAAFYNYAWPGNIRELQNIIERMVNICNGEFLTIDQLPKEILFNDKSKSFVLPVQSYERDLIIKLLKINNGNITRVSNELGIARTTLYQKIAKYKI